jgi:hypothetical protein
VYISTVRFEWDEQKRLSNLEKHGLDFLDAAVVFETPHVEAPSVSFPFGGHAMKREKNIRSYTAAELKARRADSRTDLTKVDAMTDEELERRTAEDEDERDLQPDWTRAMTLKDFCKRLVCQWSLFQW